MKKLLRIIVLMALPGVVFSQDKIDSLKRVIAGKSGIEKFEPMVALSRTWWYMDSTKHATAVLDDARSLALEFGDTIKIIQACWMTGVAYDRLTFFEESEKILTWAIPVAKRHGKMFEWSSMMNCLGIIYTYHARYNDALRIHFENLQKRSERHDFGPASTCLNNIGLVYYKLKDYRRALRYHKEAVDEKRKNGNSFNLDLTLLNVAHCYAYLKKYDSARLYTAEALNECGKKCSASRIKDAEFIRGLSDLGEGNFGDAERHFLKSYSIAKEIKDIRFQFDNIDYLSGIYIQQGRFEKALGYLREAEKIIDAGVSLNLEVIKIFKRFFDLYSRIHDFRMASRYQQKYIHLRDSIYDEELTTSLMKTEADYLERENKTRLEAQANLLVLNQKMIDRQRVVNILIGLSAILLLVVAVVLYRSNRQRMHINRILDERVKLRTLELERSREELLQTARRNSLVIERSAREMKAVLSTIKGLCAIGYTEGENQLPFIDRLESASDKLMLELRSVEKLAEQQVSGETALQI